MPRRPSRSPRISSPELRRRLSEALKHSKRFRDKWYIWSEVYYSVRQGEGYCVRIGAHYGVPGAGGSIWHGGTSLGCGYTQKDANAAAQRWKRQPKKRWPTR